MKSSLCRCLLESGPSLPSRERGLKSRSRKFSTTLKAVAPFAGAWIEMIKVLLVGVTRLVAPFAGAWIEIAHTALTAAPTEVAPFAGAWIEIHLNGNLKTYWNVAPFAGAWIEILTSLHSIVPQIPSLPSRERGLKLPLSF